MSSKRVGNRPAGTLSADQLICPTDGTIVNESKVRVVAFLVLLTAIGYAVSGWLWLPLLLTVDFALRGLGQPAYSPLGYVADGLIRTFRLPNKPTNGAPKRFAARIGLAFGVLIIGVHLLGSLTAVPTAVLAIFAALESLAGFCAGCYVYTYYVRLFPGRA